MKLIRIVPVLTAALFLLSACGLLSRTASTGYSPPSESATSTVTKSEAFNSIETGVASWYGPDFHGRLTANGEKYDMNGLTAAHRTLPFNTQVIVENLDNGKKVEVRINDRGPFAKDRIIDLSKAAAERVDIIGPGTANVKIYLVNGDEIPADLKRARYTVQLGSYGSRELADQKSSEIRSSYVEEVEVNGGKVYRIYFGDFDDAKVAQEALNRLEGLGHDGFVKQIQ